MGRGRPTKFTADVQERIIDAIRKGNYFEAACASAGVNYVTFRLWMVKGRDEGEGDYFDFFEQVNSANADAEVEIVTQWKEQVPEDWRAAKDFLARRYPKRWAASSTLDVTTKGLPLHLELAALTDEQLRRIANGEDPGSVVDNEGTSGD